MVARLGILPNTYKEGNSDQVLHEKTDMVCLPRRGRTGQAARQTRNHFGHQTQRKGFLYRGWIPFRLRTAVSGNLSQTHESHSRTGVAKRDEKYQRAILSTRIEHRAGMTAIWRQQRVLERLCVRTGHFPLLCRVLPLCGADDRVFKDG